MGVRKNYRNLTDVEVERDRFVQALQHVKSTGVVKKFAEMHKRHFFHGIHVSSHFLPWHREMLLRFERELQKFHPDVTIPYWDSTVDSNMSAPLWNNSFLGQFDSAWNLGRQLGSDTLPTSQQVETNQRRDTYDAFWPELEADIHNPPHRWVGGVMATAASPGDPVFYLHHCWIDMLWVKWQLAHPSAPFVPSRPDLGLNDPLMEWPDRTPADVLDHHALGYSYDTEAFVS
jgi:Common central domain of tyrosinase